MAVAVSFPSLIENLTIAVILELILEFAKVRILGHPQQGVRQRSTVAIVAPS